MDPITNSAHKVGSSHLTTRVIKGSLWTFAGQVAPLLVSFVTTPIIISLAGADGYGVIVLLSLIVQYLYFTDFGMVMASTKFGSEAYAAGDAELEGRILRNAGLLALVGSVPAAILVSIFSREAADIFGVSEHLREEASIAISLAAVSLIPFLLSYIVNSPQLARLRMDLNSLSITGSRIVGLIGVPVAIYLGYGIVGAAVMFLLAITLNLVAQFAFSYSLLPQIVGLSLDRRYFKPMIRFGKPMAFASFAAMGVAHLEKWALAALLSVTELAYYSVAFALAGILTFLSTSMMQSLIPAFSQLQGEDLQSQRNRLYGRCVRMMLIFASPVLVVFGIVAEPFFTRWAGPSFGRESTLPFYILLCGLGFSLLANIATSAIIASGRTDVMARVYWLQLPPYAVLVWFLVSGWGVAGAALAWSIRAIVDAGIQFALANRFADVHLPAGRWSATAFATGVMIFPLLAYLFLEIGFIAVLILALACLCAYAILIWKTVIEPDERTWIKEGIGGTFGIR